MIKKCGGIIGKAGGTAFAAVRPVTPACKGIQIAGGFAVKFKRNECRNAVDTEIIKTVVAGSVGGIVVKNQNPKLQVG